MFVSDSQELALRHDVQNEITMRIAPEKARVLVSDIDGTIVESGHTHVEPEPFCSLVQKHRGQWMFAVSTGRNLAQIRDAINKFRLPQPDIMIASVGSEIFYGPDAKADLNYQEWLKHDWNRASLVRSLAKCPWIYFQESPWQNDYKISYFLKEEYSHLNNDDFTPYVRESGFSARVIVSHGKYLDILPVRGGKGGAVEYLRQQWGFRRENILVCGDSGNDRDMYEAADHGVVVGNHYPELSDLRGRPGIWFSEQKSSRALIEGLNRLGWIRL